MSSRAIETRFNTKAASLSNFTLMSRKAIDTRYNTKAESFDDILTELQICQKNGNEISSATHISYLKRIQEYIQISHTALSSHGTIISLLELLQKMNLNDFEVNQEYISFYLNGSPKVKKELKDRIVKQIENVLTAAFDFKTFLSIIHLSDLDEFKDFFPKWWTNLEAQNRSDVMLKHFIPAIFSKETNENDVFQLQVLMLDLLKMKLSDAPEADVKDFLKQTSPSLVKFIAELQEAKNNNWSKYWMFLLKFCGIALHSSMELTNQLLRVVENAFRNSNFEERLTGYRCWMVLIENAALDMTRMCSPKQMKLLLTPLKAKFSRQEIVINKRFEVFLYLLDALGTNATLCLTEILEFCFGQVSETSDPNKTGQGKAISSLWGPSIDLLLDLFGVDQIRYNHVLKTRAVITPDVFKIHWKVLINSVGEASLFFRDGFSNCAQVRMMSKKLSELWKHILALILQTNKDKSVEREYFQCIVKYVNQYIHEAVNNRDFKYFYNPLFVDFFKNFQYFRFRHLCQYMLEPVLDFIFKTESSTIPTDVFEKFITNVLKHNKMAEEKLLLEITTKPLPNLPYWSVIWMVIVDCCDEYDGDKQEILLWPLLHLDILSANKSVTNLWEKKLKQTKIISTRYEVIKKIEEIVCSSSELNSCLNSFVKPLYTLRFRCLNFQSASLILNITKEVVDNKESFAFVKSELKDFFKSVFIRTDFLSQDMQNIIKVSQCLETIFTKHKDYSLITPFIEYLKMAEPNVKTLIRKQFAAYLELCTDSDHISWQELQLVDCLNAIELLPPKTRIEKIISPQPLRKPNIFDTLGSPKVRGSQLQNISNRTKKIMGTKSSLVTPPRKLNIVDEKSSDFVPINTEVQFDPSKLSEHQKEVLGKRREDIPALYEDLTQSQSQDFFISKKKENDDFKKVIVEKLPQLVDNPEVNINEEKQTEVIPETEIGLRIENVMTVVEDNLIPDTEVELLEPKESKENVEDKSNVKEPKQLTQRIRNSKIDNSINEIARSIVESDVEVTKKMCLELKKIQMNIVGAKEFLPLSRRTRSKIENKPKLYAMRRRTMGTLSELVENSNSEFPKSTKSSDTEFHKLTETSKSKLGVEENRTSVKHSTGQTKESVIESSSIQESIVEDKIESSSMQKSVSKDKNESSSVQKPAIEEKSADQIEREILSQDEEYIQPNQQQLSDKIKKTATKELAEDENKFEVQSKSLALKTRGRPKGSKKKSPKDPIFSLTRNTTFKKTPRRVPSNDLNSEDIIESSQETLLNLSVSNRVATPHYYQKSGNILLGKQGLKRKLKESETEEPKSKKMKTVLRNEDDSVTNNIKIDTSENIKNVISTVLKDSPQKITSYTSKEKDSENINKNDNGSPDKIKKSDPNHLRKNLKSTEENSKIQLKETLEDTKVSEETAESSAEKKTENENPEKIVNELTDFEKVESPEKVNDDSETITKAKLDELRRFERIKKRINLNDIRTDTREKNNFYEIDIIEPMVLRNSSPKKLKQDSEIETTKLDDSRKTILDKNQDNSDDINKTESMVLRKDSPKKVKQDCETMKTTILGDLRISNLDQTLGGIPKDSPKKMKQDSEKNKKNESGGLRKTRLELTFDETENNSDKVNKAESVTLRKDSPMKMKQNSEKIKTTKTDDLRKHTPEKIKRNCDELKRNESPEKMKQGGEKTKKSELEQLEKSPEKTTNISSKLKEGNTDVMKLRELHIYIESPQKIKSTDSKVSDKTKDNLRKLKFHVEDEEIIKKSNDLEKRTIQVDLRKSEFHIDGIEELKKTNNEEGDPEKTKHILRKPKLPIEDGEKLKKSNDSNKTIFDLRKSNCPVENEKELKKSSKLEDDPEKSKHVFRKPKINIGDGEKSKKSNDSEKITHDLRRSNCPIQNEEKLKKSTNVEDDPEKTKQVLRKPKLSLGDGEQSKKNSPLENEEKLKKSNKLEDDPEKTKQVLRKPKLPLGDGEQSKKNSPLENEEKLKKSNKLEDDSEKTKHILRKPKLPIGDGEKSKTSNDSEKTTHDLRTSNCPIENEKLKKSSNVEDDSEKTKHVLRKPKLPIEDGEQLKKSNNLEQDSDKVKNNLRKTNLHIEEQEKLSTSKGLEEDSEKTKTDLRKSNLSGNEDRNKSSRLEDSEKTKPDLRKRKLSVETECGENSKKANDLEEGCEKTKHDSRKTKLQNDNLEKNKKTNDLDDKIQRDLRKTKLHNDNPEKIKKPSDLEETEETTVDLKKSKLVSEGHSPNNLEERFGIIKDSPKSSDENSEKITSTQSQIEFVGETQQEILKESENRTQTETESCESNFKSLTPELQYDVPKKHTLTESEEMMSTWKTISVISDITLTPSSPVTPKKLVVNVENTVSTPLSSEKSLPTSPVTGDTPNKTTELLNNTLDISPINSFCGPEPTGVLVHDLEQKLDDKLFEMCNRSGRVLSLLHIDSPVTHKKSLKRRTNIMMAMSPSSARIKKLLSGLDPKRNEGTKKPEPMYTEEDILTLTREVPSPYAVPERSILKRKFSDIAVEGISPIPKRKRVNFSDPIMTSKKIFLKDDHPKTNDSIKDIEVMFEDFDDYDGDEDDDMEILTGSEASPIYPDLIGCKDDICLLDQNLIPATMMNLKTIGELAQLSDFEINKHSTDRDTIYDLLEAYYKKTNCTTLGENVDLYDQNENDGQVEIIDLVEEDDAEKQTDRDIILNSDMEINVEEESGMEGFIKNELMLILETTNSQHIFTDVSKLLIEFVNKYDLQDNEDSVKKLIESLGFIKTFSTIIKSIDEGSRQGLDEETLLQTQILDNILIPLFEKRGDISKYLQSLKASAYEHLLVLPLDKHQINECLSKIAEFHDVIGQFVEEYEFKMRKAEFVSILNSCTTVVSGLPSNYESDELMNLYRVINNKLPEKTVMKLFGEFLKEHYN